MEAKFNFQPSSLSHNARDLVHGAFLVGQLRTNGCCGHDRLSKHTVSLSTGHGPAGFCVFAMGKAHFFLSQRHALKSDDGVPPAAGGTIVDEGYHPKAGPRCSVW